MRKLLLYAFIAFTITLGAYAGPEQAKRVEVTRLEQIQIDSVPKEGLILVIPAGLELPLSLALSGDIVQAEGGPSIPIAFDRNFAVFLPGTSDDSLQFSLDEVRWASWGDTFDGSFTIEAEKRASDEKASLVLKIVVNSASKSVGSCSFTAPSSSR